MPTINPLRLPISISFIYLLGVIALVRKRAIRRAATTRKRAKESEIRIKNAVIAKAKAKQ